jgi:hypothetical protein
MAIPKGHRYFAFISRKKNNERLLLLLSPKISTKLLLPATPFVI